MNDEPKTPMIAESLITTLRQNLIDSLVELGEVAFDATLNEGLLRELPVLGTLLAVGRTGIAIRDALFTRKLLNFLNSAATVSREERQRFVDDVEARGEVRELGEALLLLLDRQEAMGKAEMLGKLFAAHMRGLCDRKTFDRLTFALDRIPMPLLEAVRTFHEGSRGTGGGELSELIGTGLVRIRFDGSINGSGARFVRTDLGSLFFKILDNEV